MMSISEAFSILERMGLNPEFVRRYDPITETSGLRNAIQGCVQKVPRVIRPDGTLPNNIGTYLIRPHEDDLTYEVLLPSQGLHDKGQILRQLELTAAVEAVVAIRLPKLNSN